MIFAIAALVRCFHYTIPFCLTGGRVMRHTRCQKIERNFITIGGIGMNPYDFITPELTPEEERKRFERLISEETEPQQMLTKKTIEPFRFGYDMPAWLFVIILGLCYFAERFAG